MFPNRIFTTGKDTALIKVTNPLPPYPPQPGLCLPKKAVVHGSATPRKRQPRYRCGTAWQPAPMVSPPTATCRTNGSQKPSPSPPSSPAVPAAGDTTGPGGEGAGLLVALGVDDGPAEGCGHPGVASLDPIWRWWRW